MTGRVELADAQGQTPRVGNATTRAQKNAGLTLIEVALIVCLFGVLLAVSMPAFVRALRTSKMAEAPEELSRMYERAAAYYAAPPPLIAETPASTARPDHAASTSMRFAASEGALAPAAVRHCMPEPAGPTPEKPSRDPVQIEFGAPGTAGSATWLAIGYEPTSPTRYRYALQPKGSGCGTLGEDSHGQVVLSLSAEGDLDGDGVLSRFERTATLADGELSLDPMLVVRDRVE